MPLNDKSGKAIAAATGLEYKGIQFDPRKRAVFYWFVDPVTGTLIGAETLEELKVKLVESRKKHSVPYRPSPWR